MGGSNPIRIQSMTNTVTRDTEACVEQAKRIIDAGGEYVRLTTQGVAEAENLKNINIGLRSQNYMNPLVADVHFNPKVAEVAALYAEKVRINPGNYVDAARTFKHLEYTDEEYAQELEKIRARFVPFLNICKENHTAIRIGVNHGSLSDRIMSRYGDTPEGMVESCMEFLRICVAEQFFNVVISIKASNTVVMVKTVRLLADVMEREGMSFPLHLGVTEAGDGEDQGPQEIHHQVLHGVDDANIQEDAQSQALSVDDHVLDIRNRHHLVGERGIQGDGVDGVDDRVLLHVRAQEEVHAEFKELPQDPDSHGEAEGHQGQERRGQMEGDPVIVVQQHHHGEAYRRGQEAVDGVEHGVPSGDYHIKGVDLTQNFCRKDEAENGDLQGRRQLDPQLHLDPAGHVEQQKRENAEEGAVSVEIPQYLL